MGVLVLCFVGSLFPSVVNLFGLVSLFFSLIRERSLSFSPVDTNPGGVWRNVETSRSLTRASNSC